ncbi:MAG: UDP-glucose 4-epimerase GalE [Marinilabiliaceae bacterium]|nr:UDP-glucose 4-epimerase GalE [Marinilabiliaceae bacterium]
MAKQILVTGGTGFIGSHTVVELQQAGFDVVIVDSLINSKEETVDNIEKITKIRPKFECFDLADREKVHAFFKKYTSIEAIIHFAALKAVGESVHKPLEYYRNNLNALMNLLECMKEYNVKNFVFSSSCTVYGQPDKLPVTETTPRKPAESPYGNTKAVAEDIMRDFTVANADADMKCLALRYFNPIGAHPSALIGESPVGVPNNLVPYITQTAAGIREQLSIFGDDYNTPDGTPIRDYINVVDLAKAHVVAINRLIEKKNKANYEFFNIGTGNGYSVMELVKAFEASTGVKLNYKVVGRRAGDIEKIWADTTYANNELGWKAETPIGETLLSAWNWEKRVRGIK